MTRTAVYDLIVDGELFYVGCSRNPRRRLHEHKARKLVPESATVVVVRWYANATLAMEAERRRITAKAPPGNIEHHPAFKAEREAKRAAVMAEVEARQRREADERFDRFWGRMNDICNEFLATPEGKAWAESGQPLQTR